MVYKTYDHYFMVYEIFAVSLLTLYTKQGWVEPALLYISHFSKPRVSAVSFHNDTVAELYSLSVHSMRFKQASASTHDVTGVHGISCAVRRANHAVSDAFKAKLPPMKSTHNRISAYWVFESRSSSRHPYNMSISSTAVMRSCFKVRRIGNWGRKFRKHRHM